MMSYQPKSFWPSDTDDTIYVFNGLPLDEIIQMAKDRFGKEIELIDISISAEHIQTECIGYDLYDAMDYKNFLVIRDERKRNV